MYTTAAAPERERSRRRRRRRSSINVGSNSSSSSSAHNSSSSTADPDDSESSVLSDKPYMWLQFEDKHIFVLGAFHRHQQSIIMAQNVVTSSEPDCVVVELCPWRGKRLEQLLQNYPHFQTPKDVESAVILAAAQLGIAPEYCDLPEHVLFQLLNQVDPKTAKEVFDVGFHESVYSLV